MAAIVSAGGVRLSYSERGDVNGPAVVFLPGPTDSWRSYEPVLAMLPDRLRAIAVSLRGHGESSKPPTGYTIEELASDVVPFLDVLGVGRAVLAGHSGSCLVARRVALDAPDRISGLILEASPTTLRSDAKLVRFVEDVVSELAEPLDVEFARSFVAGTSADDLPPQLVDALAEDLLKVPVHAWKEMFASLLRYDDTSELPRMTAPTLLVWGEADDLVGSGMQEQLVQLLPRADLVVYERAGHTPRWEQPDRFARDVATFTAGVSG